MVLKVWNKLPDVLTIFLPQMIVQALEYERRGRDTGPNGGRFLQSFFDSTRGKFTHPKVKEWVEELERQRDTEFPKTQ
jgi:hypothetical protein